MFLLPAGMHAVCRWQKQRCHHSDTPALILLKEFEGRKMGSKKVSRMVAETCSFCNDRDTLGPKNLYLLLLVAVSLEHQTD